MALALATGCMALASPSAPAAELDAAAMASLVQKARKHVARMDRAYWMYHYSYHSEAPGAGSASGRDEILRILSARANRQSDLTQPQDGNVGNGLYFAVDPWVSRQWGGEDWHLFAARIPQGAAYLDLGRYFGENLTLAERAALKKIGCQATTLHQLFWVETECKRYGIPEKNCLIDAPCRETNVALLREIGVSLVKYPWIGFATKACPAGGNRRFAFMAIDDTFLTDAVELRIFDRDSRALNAGDKHRELIQALFAGATPEGAGSLWPRKDVPPATFATVRPWAQANLFGCAKDER